MKSFEINALESIVYADDPEKPLTPDELSRRCRISYQLARDIVIAVQGTGPTASASLVREAAEDAAWRT